MAESVTFISQVGVQLITLWELRSKLHIETAYFQKRDGSQF